MKRRVLFLCTHNSARSQMAAAGIDLRGHTSIRARLEEWLRTA